jgi:hypothetical protein
MTTTLDRDEIAAFVNMVTGKPDTPCIFACLPDHPDAFLPAHQHCGKLLDVLPELTSANACGCGIFLTVNSMGQHRRRTRDNCHRVRALCLDADDTPEPETWDPMPAPVMVVGRSPTRWSAWWPLELPDRLDGVACEAGRNAWGRLQKALALQFGGDPSVSDLARVMRVPGTTHWKAGLDQDDPPRYRIRSMRQQERWPWQAIAARLGLDEAELAQPEKTKAAPSAGLAKPGTASQATMDRLRTHLAGLVVSLRAGGGARHPPLLAWVGDALVAGAGADQVREWIAAALEDLGREPGPGEVDRMLEHATQRVATGEWTGGIGAAVEPAKDFAGAGGEDVRAVVTTSQTTTEEGATTRPSMTDLAASCGVTLASGADLAIREVTTALLASLGGADAVAAGSQGAAAIVQAITRCLEIQGLTVDAREGFRIGGQQVDQTTKTVASTIWWACGAQQRGALSRTSLAQAVEDVVEVMARAARAAIVAQIIGRDETDEAGLALAELVGAMTGRAAWEVAPADLLAMQQWLWCAKRKMAGLRVDQHIMPVFVGPQGCGKTRGVLRLLEPLEELAVGSATMEAVTDEKCRRVVSQVHAMFFDELAGLAKADIGRIKQIITSADVSYRPMRTNQLATVPNASVFIGASNIPIIEIARDPTGMRRFYELDCAGMGYNGHRSACWDRINAIDMLALWRGAADERQTTCPMMREENREARAEVSARQATMVEETTVQAWAASGAWLGAVEEAGEGAVKNGGAIDTALLYAHFRAWAEAAGERYPPTRVWFGRQLGRIPGWVQRRATDSIGSRSCAWIPPTSRGGNHD